MGYLRHFLPFEASRIANGFLQARGGAAISHDIEPVAVSAVFGHSPFVRCEQDGARGSEKPFDLDQPELAGFRSRLVMS